MRASSGAHAVDITAVDDDRLENTISLGVLVDPELVLELGYLKEVDLIERVLVVDDVEFLTGDDAVRAAVEDGVIADGEDLPIGIYLRKQDPQPHTPTLGDPGVIGLQAYFPHPGAWVTEQAVRVDLPSELLADPERAVEELGWSWYGHAGLPYWFAVQDGSSSSGSVSSTCPSGPHSDHWC